MADAAKWLFIGGGNMAEAILSGALARGVATPDGVVVAEVRAERRAELEARYGVATAESAAAKAGSDEWVKEWVKRAFQLRMDMLDRDWARAEERRKRLTGSRGDLAKANQDLSDSLVRRWNTENMVDSLAAARLMADIAAGAVDVAKLPMPEERRAALAVELEKWNKAAEEYDKKCTEIYGEDDTRKPTKEELGTLEAVLLGMDNIRVTLNHMLQELGEPMRQAVDKVLNDNPELKRQLEEDNLEITAARNRVAAVYGAIAETEGQLEEISHSVREYAYLVDRMQRQTEPPIYSDYTNVEEELWDPFPPSPVETPEGRSEGAPENVGQPSVVSGERSGPEAPAADTGDVTEVKPPSDNVAKGDMGDVSRNLPPGEELPVDRNTSAMARLAALADLLGDPPDDLFLFGGGTSVESASGAVLLAVKPQQAAEAVRDAAAAGLLDGTTLLVSICAGLTTERLESWCGARVVRVMPNLPATVQCGVAAVSAGSRATAEDVARTKALFAAVGDVVEVPEALLDLVTGVSGSGPGYVFAFMEALEDAAVAGGMERGVARRLAIATVRGAGELAAREAAREGGADPAELRRRVSSKGGTTLAGLAAMEARGFAAAVAAAVSAATRRAAELSGGC